MSTVEHFAAIAARRFPRLRPERTAMPISYARHHFDPLPPVAVTHTGPAGTVRAHRWIGTLAGARTFLDSGGSVAYRLAGRLLVVDVDGGPEQVAEYGDWLVWSGGELVVVTAAEFARDYREVGA